MKTSFEKFEKQCLELVETSTVISSLFNTICLMYVSDTELPPYSGNFLIFKESIAEEIYNDNDNDNNDNDLYFFTREKIINHLKSFIK